MLCPGGKKALSKFKLLNADILLIWTLSMAPLVSQLLSVSQSLGKLLSLVSHSVSYSIRHCVSLSGTQLHSQKVVQSVLLSASQAPNCTVTVTVHSQSVSCSISYSVSQSGTQLHSHSHSHSPQSVSQSVSCSISHSVSQSGTQLHSQLVSCSIGHSVSQ